MDPHRERRIWPEWSERKKAGVALLNDNDASVDEFGIGESVALAAWGLKPATSHEVRVALDDSVAFTLQLMSDEDGVIEPTVLWAQAGLDDPASNALFTPDEARERWDGTTINVQVEGARGRALATKARLSGERTRPLVLVSDEAGRVRSAVERGRKEPIFVTAWEIPAADGFRVYLTTRQHDWHIGDPLEPVALLNGERAVLEARGDHKEGRGRLRIELPLADLLPIAAYDVIVRPLRYGFEDNDLAVLLEHDIVGSRRITALVVRESFWTAKPVLGGCVNKLPISGRAVAGPPYHRYTDTFETGAAVWAALDPGIVDPANVGKMCALYVVPSKTEPQWNADPALNHLAVLGGNAAVTRIKLQSYCVNANRVLLWPNATEMGEYDIVADFGNNSTDAAAFMPDARYDTPLDIIDGYFVAGFRVVDDPGTLAEWTNVGRWTYTESSAGSASVQDEHGGYSTPGGFSTVNWTVPLRANVYFPADGAGATLPSQVSTVRTDYPLVVIVHGQGHDYTSYDFLLEHFARNGFVAASIHLSSGMHGLGRANVLFQHIARLRTTFGTQLQNRIGLMGHSRGGEAIIKAARLNHTSSLGHGIDALIALGPTDQYGHETLGGAHAKPLLVVHGSRDGDIVGEVYTPGYTAAQSGFALYDRATGQPKHMAFVHRATHNGFITGNYDAAWRGDSPAACLPVATQQQIAKAYMNAFFRLHLKADARWEGIFSGEWEPPSVATTGAKIYLQTRRPGQRVVDDFQSAPTWNASSIGGAVTHAGLPATPAEGRLRSHPSAAGLDPKSPHDSNGMGLRWDGTGDRLDWAIPAGQRDVTGFAALSFRIGQRVDSPHNAAGQPQNLRVTLRDGGGSERAVRVSAFEEIPFPDVRANNAITLSALNTIRIPLTSYTIVCAGVPQVDLADVVSAGFTFSETPTGEVEIDEIEFTA